MIPVTIGQHPHRPKDTRPKSKLSSRGRPQKPQKDNRSGKSLLSLYMSNHVVISPCTHFYCRFFAVYFYSKQGAQGKGITNELFTGWERYICLVVNSVPLKGVQRNRVGWLVVGRGFLESIGVIISCLDGNFLFTFILSLGMKDEPDWDERYDRRRSVYPTPHGCHIRFAASRPAILAD